MVAVVVVLVVDLRSVIGIQASPYHTGTHACDERLVGPDEGGVGCRDHVIHVSR